MAVKVDVGKRIKEYRQRYNLTLKEIESRVDVSATHVSEIERGKTSPTVGALSKIAAALEVDPALFLAGDNLPDVAVSRAGERSVVRFEQERLGLEALSGAVPSQALSVVLMTWEPGTGHGPPRVREGEEFGLVISGKLDVRVGEQTYVVCEGDSIHFRADVPHSVANAGDGPCHAIWATSPKLGF
jgi:transcriptional regulator with XRE-family HTH domain